MAPGKVTREDLARAARAALGSECEIREVTRDRVPVGGLGELLAAGTERE
jgi:hypothetical protein